MLSQSTGTGSETLDRVLARLGYAYDADQAIFCSTMHAWQRNFGYCRLYDEAAPLLSMIIDCEPISFSYRGKRWLIQFWKGQYALTAGCEIGVYMTGEPDMDIPGVFSGPFYSAAGDADLLQLSFTLYRRGKILMSREAKHWWLTGFILGEFAEPGDLAMYITVTLKDETMRHAFVNGLIRAGYRAAELTVNGARVGLRFTAPRTEQPATRTPSTDWLIQRKNEMLCRIYRNMAGQGGTIADQLQAVKEQSPGLYDQALNIGKTALLYESYGLLQHSAAVRLPQ